MSNPRLWGPIEIRGGNAQFVQAVRRDLDRINHYRLGREVYRLLDGSGCSIEFNGNQNTCSTTSYFRPLGVNRPNVTLSLNYFSIRNPDPTTERVRQRGMIWVYLFHELVHCLHVVDSYMSPLGSPIDEFRTTGLYQYANERISENAFRREAGLPRRPAYNWVDPSDTLDAEKQVRAAGGLPADPQDYMSGVEDDFSSWHSWLNSHGNAWAPAGHSTIRTPGQTGRYYY